MLEELRHSFSADMVGHKTSPAAKQEEGDKAADDSVSDSDPGSGRTVDPAELTSVTDENNGGKVGRSVGESGQP